MADLQPSQIRIGDTERESALSALGEHMSAGRLDIDEYGDRTARVSAAKTRGELIALFTDLPKPHPTFGVEPPLPPGAEPAVPRPRGVQVPLRHRLAAAALPLAGLASLLLYFTVIHFWIVFLIPAAVVVLGSSLWGDDWKHQRRMARDRYREERRQTRRQRHW
ncbi:MAG TPA: DUF1707 domain-containing protein [Pseudonocardiaceae bacterium]|nr:DUF1707 domain-containing protein [Pseudonocardiaceae bacterium]